MNLFFILMIVAYIGYNYSIFYPKYKSAGVPGSPFIIVIEEEKMWGYHASLLLTIKGEKLRI